ncbi:transmembrane protein 71 isoform X2 [Arapaima gigas]
MQFRYFYYNFTGSPIKKGDSLVDQSCHSLGMSLLSPELTYQCYSLNPLTGSLCSCRRSPRLLSNGYYVLTEDSYVCDDDGNVSLTPSKTNVSYKENLVRIFRRRRRPRRSLASLFEVSQSWLEEKVFGGVYGSPLAESSWLEESATELSRGYSFVYDHSEDACPLDKKASFLIPDMQACHPQEHLSQTPEGFLDVLPPLAFEFRSCCQQKPKPADCAVIKGFILLFLTICLFIAVFSRSLLGEMAVVSVTFILVLMSFVLAKSVFRTRTRWHRAKTEVISSRNE